MSTIKPYRLIHVAEDFSKVSGGVPAVVYELSGKIVKTGIETHVFVAITSQ